MRTDLRTNAVPARDEEAPVMDASSNTSGIIPFPIAIPGLDNDLQKSRDYQWVLASFPLWGPIRAAFRFGSAVAWIAVCYTAFIFVSILRLFSRSFGMAAQKQVSRMWVRGMRAILGIRIRCEGQFPADPYFLVLNHLSWQDFFVVNCLCDVVCVVQAEDEKLPFAGTLITGLTPIFIKRVREDTPRVLALMVDAMREGNNLLMAPEGVVGPGREVRTFHPSLFEAAVRMHRPIHYMCVNYRTPEGCPPPSKVALFGPDPFYRTPDGRIPDSELEAWGPERSFFTHLLRLLALPWHEVHVQFAAEPVHGNDRIELACRSREAIQRIFTPVP